MSDEHFSGTWLGQYTYRRGYRNQRDQSVSFSLHMSVTDVGIISGNCFDHNHPFDDPATLEGFIDNDFISFVKRYPHAYFSDGEGNLLLEPDKPSHEIHYTGNFMEGMFTGNWEIVSHYTTISGQRMLMGGNGTWDMQRYVSQSE